MRNRLMLLPGCIALAGVLATSPIAAAPACDPDNGGLTLAEGFCALVVADNLGRAGHLTVSQTGDVFVALRRDNGGGIVGLRDEDDDGRADVIERFGKHTGTGIGMHKGFLYFASDTQVMRYRMDRKSLLPVGDAEVIVDGFAEQSQHAAKPFAFDQANGLYVNIGAPSNACQRRMRQAGSAGIDPCPQLRTSGGIWRFDATKANQQAAQGTRYATGIRNAMAITWNPVQDQLFVVQHGRDQLSELWPKYFRDQDRAELPAEELLAVEEGDDFGWPYCFYDPFVENKVLAPEYGGDGKQAGRCAQMKAPLHGFPAHWAPNAMVFYTARQFPTAYHDGALIAFHGSWNRQPFEQKGYRVTFVPFNGARAGQPRDFATGFAGSDSIKTPRQANYRPTGLALGPDGSVYIADSVKGRIWRVMHNH